MNNIRFVLSDIDGTLLTSEKTVSPKTRDAIAKLKDHGILFGIATGRTPYAVRHLIKDWGIEAYTDYILGFNGSAYYDVKNEKVMSFDLLQKGTIESVLNDFKDFDFNLGLYDHYTFIALKDDEYSRMIASSNKIELKIDDLMNYNDRELEKLMIMAQPDVVDQMLEHFQQSVHSDCYKAIKSEPMLIEIIHPMLSKSRGIQRLINDLGIQDNQVITFGDELNDYEMIRDYYGVAMENANSKVKAVASYITLSNDLDGIAAFINHQLLNEK